MFPNKTIIKLYFFAFVFLYKQCYCQDFSFFPKDIKMTAELYSKAENIEALQYNFNALAFYEKNNDKKKIVTIYTNIGFLSFAFGKHRESIHYLDKAKKMMEDNNLKDPLLMARLYSEYAKNDTRLGILNKSNDTFDEAINYAYRISDHKQKQYMLYYCYTWKRFNFLNNQDSLQKIDKILVNMMPSGVTYAKIADRFITHRKLDSAEYYLSKASGAPDKNFKGIQGLILFTYGNLYNIKNNPEKSIEYYLKASALFQEAQLKPPLRRTYDSLVSDYQMIGDIKTSKVYLEKFRSINKLIKKEEKEATNLVTDQLLNDNLKEKRKKEKLAIGIAISLIVVFLVILYIRNKINLSKHTEKDRILEQEALKVQKLERQIYNSFDQITELAKSSDPFFLIKFKEVYPEFFENLLKHNNRLTDNDIKFCAYIKLNLSNKEVATFTKLTFRSVETTKYRLKKKLGLSADLNLNKWIQNL